MKRKLLCGFLAVFLLVLSVAGCGAKDGEQKAGGQGQSKYKIGIFVSGDEKIEKDCLDGFREGLAAYDYIEDKNTEFLVVRPEEDEEALEEQEEDVAKSKIDLCMGIGTKGAQAAYDTIYGYETPGLFLAVDDPYKSGLTKKNGAPTANVTGITSALTPSLQIRMIRDLLPNATKVGVIYMLGLDQDEDLDAKGQFTDAMIKVAKENGISTEKIIIDDPTTIADVITNNLSEVDCYINVNDKIPSEILSAEANAAVNIGIPLFGANEEQVVRGVYASQRVDYWEMGYDAGVMAAKMLLFEMNPSYEFCREARKAEYLIHGGTREILDAYIPTNIPDRIVTIIPKEG